MRAAVPLLLALWSACTFAEADQFAAPRAFIRQLLVDTPTPSVAVAVARDGKILWEEGFGWADREHRIPATEHTMYSLASTSKPITATGLMTLVAAGKVDLERPANDYLGDAHLVARVGDARDATVRRLANHSAGLPRHFQYFFADEPWRCPPTDLTILRYGNLVTAPGERYTYSNLGTSLLGYIVERVSGKSYADYMRVAVFLPLGMTRTVVNVGQPPGPELAVRYDQSNAPLPPYVSDTPGAADIYSSAHDLARFGMFHLKSHRADQAAILPDALIDAMHRPGTPVSLDRSYGLGWHVQNRTDGYRSVYHGGGLAGSSTVLLLVPAKNVAVVVLVNRFSRTDTREYVSEITNRIVRVLVPDWNLNEPLIRRATPTLVPIETLAGTWQGTLHTPKKELPLRFDVLDSGEIRAQLGEQRQAVLTDVRLDGDWLEGTMTADVGTEDASRYRSTYLQFGLTRRGDVLNGGATLGSDQERAHIEGMSLTLTHWVELRKQK